MAVSPDFPNSSDRFSSTLPQAQERQPPAYTSASWNSPAPPQPPPPEGLSANAWALIGLAIVIAIVTVAFAALIFIDERREARQFNESQRKAAWHHAGEVARPDQLAGSGRIYLIQLGPHSDPYLTVELSDWLRRKYSLDTEVLNPLPLDPAAWDASRHRYIAELLNAQIKREHPALAADPNAFLIGFTDAEMYSATEPWSSSFSQRDHHRAAIISSSGMGDLAGFNLAPAPGQPRQTPTARFNDRIRRILLKDIAVLFWHLPLNNDRGSILYYVLNPDVPNDDIYQSDLDPAASESGEYVSDPCVVFTYSAARGLHPSVDPITGKLIRPCETPESASELQSNLGTPDSPPDTGAERMELRLRYGMMTEKHTDFFLPGPVPIRFERATNNQWEQPGAFGMSGSHNYDRYLATHDDMRHIYIGNAGSGDDNLVRVPLSVPFLFFNRWHDTDDSGSNLRLRWRAGPVEHFDLIRYNGEVDSYMPCTDRELCYLNGYHNAKGDRLDMARDSLRRLTSLTAPQDNSLHFTYDSQPETQQRIAEIADSKGRRVVYRYNSRGQLQSVTYPAGETLSYAYDKTHNLITVSAAPNASAPSKVLITNVCQNGRVASQTLADGSVYTYIYGPVEEREVSTATIHLPDGTVFDISLNEAGAAMRRRPVR